MTHDELIAYCLALPGAWPDRPWEDEVVVKVHTKIFAFIGHDGASVGVKCGATREEADEWLRRFPQHAALMPYIGRSGWNTLRFGGAIPDEEILEAIENSYDLVVARLPRRHRPSLSP